MNKIIDGKLVSDQIKEKLKEKIAKLDIKPCLAVIQVGDDTASCVYVKNKQKAAINIGMDFKHVQFPTQVEEDEVIKKIDDLNRDDMVNGIIVQLPLPKHLDSNHIINRISPIKDVDGLTQSNLGKLFAGTDCLTSCTPTGIIELLKYYNIDIEGKHALIVGRSNLVGKPLIHLLLKENATVTVCHSKTNNLATYTKEADILVVAVGSAKLIKADMVKENATVIDVGINRIDGKLTGDVDFDAVLDKVMYITPVPGGVGPMTVAILLKNTLKSYDMMQKEKTKVLKKN